MIVRVLFLVILFILSSCTNNVSDFENENIGTTTQEIVNGNKVSHSDYPSIAGIILEGHKSPRCTATFIRPNVVMTAKHCVVGISVNSLFIVYGYNKINLDDGRDYNLIPVAIKALHPSADLALLYVIDFPKNVQYADILHPYYYDDVLDKDNFVTIAGYGRIGTNIKNYALYAGETIVNEIVDNRIYVGMCDEEENVAVSCFGDSGGPIYVTCNHKRYVTGVSSKVVGEVCGDGAIYVLPGLYLNWINETYDTMRDIVQDPCIECPIGANQYLTCIVNKSELDCDGCNIGSSSDTGFYILFILFMLFISKSIKNRHLNSDI